GGMPPTGYLEASQMQFEPDGSFEILLSADPPAGHSGNLLPMTHETGTLVVRQTFLDRANETPATLEIGCLSVAPGELRKLTAEQLDEGLRSASTLVAGASLLFAKWARDFQAHSNELPLFDPERSDKAGGDP